ncbi:MAG TPA: hypothetical protein VK530_17830 [Candidatus Acidoferrum sp.]|nr:hypothetical protein [Candidatus Acidoferrum sp.]
MKKMVLLLCNVALIAVVNGCARGGNYDPKNTAKFNQEDTSKFVLLDAGAQKSVTSTGIQEGKTSDGRMKVVANLRNRENRRIEVQVSCVFKDAQAFSIDETPYRTLILDENSTQSVMFESFRKDAAKYTVRVRQAR